MLDFLFSQSFIVICYLSCSSYTCALYSSLFLQACVGKVIERKQYSHVGRISIRPVILKVIINVTFWCQVTCSKNDLLDIFNVPFHSSLRYNRQVYETPLGASVRHRMGEFLLSRVIY